MNASMNDMFQLQIIQSKIYEIHYNGLCVNIPY